MLLCLCPPTVQQHGDCSQVPDAHSCWRSGNWAKRRMWAHPKREWNTFLVSKFNTHVSSSFCIYSSDSRRVSLTWAECYTYQKQPYYYLSYVSPPPVTSPALPSLITRTSKGSVWGSMGIILDYFQPHVTNTDSQELSFLVSFTSSSSSLSGLPESRPVMQFPPETITYPSASWCLQVRPKLMNMVLAQYPGFPKHIVFSLYKVHLLHWILSAICLMTYYLPFKTLSVTHLLDSSILN